MSDLSPLPPLPLGEGGTRSVDALPLSRRERGPGGEVCSGELQTRSVDALPLSRRERGPGGEVCPGGLQWILLITRHNRPHPCSSSANATHSSPPCTRC